MKVTMTKQDGKWRWHLTDERLNVNAGSTRVFRLKFNCRRNFKRRYLALIKKRKHWPSYRDVLENET